MNTYINTISSLIPYSPINLQTFYRYRCNTFFNPNICHFCKCPLIYQSSIPCICNMIFYCTQDHKEKHSKEHNFFCQHLQEVLRNVTVDHTGYSYMAWVQSRHKILDAINARIPEYEIKPYEKDMIMFAKSCFVCFRTDRDLKTCSVCYTVNYCSYHEENFKSYDKFRCKMLLLCLNAQIVHCSFSYNKQFENFYLNNCVLPDHMVNFVLKHIRLIEYNKSGYSNQGGIMEMTGEELCYSEYVSGVLTLYNIMQKYQVAINKESKSIKPQIVLHVINFDVKHLLSWEILLHFTSIHQLIIVLIGEKDLKIKSHYHTLCKECKEKSRLITYRYFPGSYTDYINHSSYIEPDIIIALHAIFYDQGKLPLSILKSKLRSFPWIFTAKTEDRATYIVQTVLNSLITVMPQYLDKNIFSSLMPQRLYIDGHFHGNEYVIFYPHLN